MASFPVLLKKAVTTAGTRVQLTATTTITPMTVYFEPLASNTGVIYIGDSAVSSTNYMFRLTIPSTTANSSIALSAPDGGRKSGVGIQLSSFWIDSSVNGDSVLCTYSYEHG